MKKAIKIIATLVMIGLVAGLPACGKSSTKSAKPQATTRVITDSQSHKVKVPTSPKRVIGSYLEDYLVALGIKPVAQWSVKNGSGTQKYLAQELKNIPTINYDLPYENVASFKPDLLLIGTDSAVQGGKYQQYNKLVPTYVVKNGANVTWRQQLLDVGKAVNKVKQAKKVLKNYDQTVKKAKKTVQKQAAGKSAAVLWVTNNSAFIVSDKAASGVLLYHELGLKVPAVVSEISKTATADWSAISLEKLAELDADYIFLVNSDKGAAMFKDHIWQNIPAVKKNHLFTYGDRSSWQYTGPIAYQEMIKDVLKDIKK